MLTWGKGWGNRELVLDGATVGVFQQGTFRERAEIDLPDGRWTFAKQFGGDIVGTGPLGDAGPRFVARKTSFWTYSWTVWTPVATYELKSGFFASGFDVLRDGVGIGSAGRAGTFTNRFSLDLPPDVPLQDQVFLLWVVEASERRRDSSSAAGAST
ncbi:hypothetical protein [Luteimicrobium subarcticum]|uniref:Uncharacterized protein n=1 Tax=Luteimicrobium subarcticum TaxID=620910 RepID=A0A2M8WRZ5_9MICO|nr:hypothetical protein [Luteimicrobium subarcticum]PJI93712.1 hypothetical protein CLV34_1186 [Luteimicrobium subarcticum]